MDSHILMDGPNCPTVCFGNMCMSISSAGLSPSKDCHTSTFAGSVRGTISVSDIVSIKSIVSATTPTIINSPGFIGRILFIGHVDQIEVRITKEWGNLAIFHNQEEHIHPDANLDLPMCRIQWYIDKTDNNIVPLDSWPILSPLDKLATKDLSEVALTKCVIWVTPDLMLDTVFVPSLEQCKHQIFGPMAGRHGAYFIRFNCILDIEDDYIEGEDGLLIPQMGPIDNDYMPFERDRFTLTERRFEYLMDITNVAQNILMKTGHLGGSYSETMKLSNQGWEYFLDRAVILDTTNSLLMKSYSANTKQKIIYSNLTLAVSQQKTKIHKVEAIDENGFGVIRRILSLGVGTGVRKSYPKLSDIGTVENYVEVHGKECVNLVDVDISDRLDAEQNAMHPTDATFQRKGNIIRFTYDDRNRTLCVHIRSTALVVGCTQTVAFRRYLQNNGIVVPGIGKPTIVGKKRRRGKGVEK